MKKLLCDYTRERRAWLRDKSVPSVTARIRGRKKHAFNLPMLAKFAAHVTSASEGAVTDRDLEL